MIKDLFTNTKTITEIIREKVGNIQPKEDVEENKIKILKNKIKEILNKYTSYDFQLNELKNAILKILGE